MIPLYRILTLIFYPLIILIIFLRKLLNKEDAIRYKEKIFSKDFNVVKKKYKKLIWFHVASIGELKSILPLIEKLNKEKENLQFLVTTVTLSSATLSKEEFKKYDNVFHRFFPVDVEFLIKKFLLLWNPSIIFLVDSEIWPNLVLNAKKNKIPIAIINARITQKTFDRWKLVPVTSKKIFNCFDLCLTANKETFFHLQKLGAKNIFNPGNLKLIGKIDTSKITNPSENILKKNRFWLAISTHLTEEALCLESHVLLKQKFKDLITIIAPRHIERIKQIELICKKRNLSTQILNENETILENKEVVLINSFGVLPKFLKFSKSVFIGKSTIKKLEKEGGQSPIDAAKLGCRIYHGQYVYNFEEIYDLLKKHKISFTINSADELAQNIEKDLISFTKDNNKFTNLMYKLEQDTLENTMNKINSFLFNENK